jgi:hypothetical protein
LPPAQSRQDGILVVREKALRNFGTHRPQLLDVDAH